MPGRDSAIDASRTLANLLVVMIHAGNLVWATSFVYPWEVVWRVAIGYGPIAYLAMPTLFLISGYLLGCGTGAWSEKIHRRALHLLVPFVVWNLVSFVEKALLSACPWREIPKVLLDLLNPIGPMPNQPLWYLRTVFLLALVSPPIFALIRRRLRIAVGLLIVWLGVTSVPCVYRAIEFSFPGYGVAAFFIGAGLALRGQSLQVLYVGPCRRLLWLAVGALVVQCVFVYFPGVCDSVVRNFGRVMVVPILLCAGAAVDRYLGREKAFVFLKDASYFIYLAHFIVCSMLFGAYKAVVHSPMENCATMGVFVYVCGGLALLLTLWWLWRRMCHNHCGAKCAIL